MADTGQYNELVPQIPMEGVQKANAELATLKLALADYEGQARSMVVDSPQTYAVAGALKVKVQDERKRWEWTIKPLKSIAQTIKDTFLTMEREGTNKCEQIEGILAAKMVAQSQREEQARLADQRRTQELINREATLVALEEKKRAEAEAAEERKRREKEIAAQARAGELSKKKAEQERMLAQALEAEKKARAMLEATAAVKNVQQIRVESNTPKIAGLRKRLNWNFKVVDEDKLPRSFMCPDLKTIGQFVRNAKDKELSEKTIPGIEVWSTDDI